MRRVLRAALVCLVLLALIAGGAGFYAHRAYDAPGPLPEARAVVVPRGGLEGIAGATMSHLQVVALSEVFAAHLGVHVTD